VIATMLDPVLLQTFLAVAQTWSFSQAAERLGLRQSTVSQHVRKLEEQAGRRLFTRDTHSVTTTADGEAMVEFARGILAANERAQRYFAGSQARAAALRRILGFRGIASTGIAPGFCPHSPVGRIRAHCWPQWRTQ
jgi:DNA-binding transcriptional LysR family regulator